MTDMSLKEVKALAYLQDVLDKIREGEMGIVSVNVDLEIETISDGLLVLKYEHTGKETITFVIRPTGK